MKKSGHHWVLITVAIIIAWHYRTQLLALWHTKVAPAIGSSLPPSVASAMGAGTHPLDVQTADNGNGRAVNLFQGVIGALTGQSWGSGPASYQNTPGGFGGGAIEEGNSQG